MHSSRKPIQKVILPDPVMVSLEAMQAHQTNLAIHGVTGVTARWPYNQIINTG